MPELPCLRPGRRRLAPSALLLLGSHRLSELSRRFDRRRDRAAARSEDCARKRRECLALYVRYDDPGRANGPPRFPKGFVVEVAPYTLEAFGGESGGQHALAFKGCAKELFALLSSPLTERIESAPSVSS